MILADLLYDKYIDAFVSGGCVFMPKEFGNDKQGDDKSDNNKQRKKMPDDDKKGQLIGRIGRLIFEGIIIAVIASVLATFIVEDISGRSKLNRMYKDVSQIYMGSGMEWMKEHFGVPNFVGSKDDYTLHAYISDYFIIQVAFDEEESVCGYLVTLIDKKSVGRLNITGLMSFEKGNPTKFDMVFGKISYYDIPSSPVEVRSFISQGVGRILYSECYYYGSSGNYNEYCFASLDFGKRDKQFDFIEYLSFDDSEADEETEGMRTAACPLLANRKKVSPNTYGVAENDGVFDVLLNYGWFDSMQLILKNK